MKQKYKHSSSSFSISVVEIKNQNLKAKIHKALLETFKGFLPTDCTDVAFSFTFTDHINSFITGRDFVQNKNIKISKNQTHFKDEELNFQYIQ